MAMEGNGLAYLPEATNPFLANPLPFGPPPDYQGGIPEDLAELGFPPRRPLPVSSKTPPGLGKFIVPHVATFQSIVNLASRTYYASFDECLKDNRSNSYVIRYDPTVMSALRDRQIPVTQLPWRIEADDESDPEQKWMADEAQKIIKSVPKFSDMRRQLLEAIYFGKYGVQTAYKWDWSRGYKRLVVHDHAPVMGDKILLTFGGRPCILVHGAYQGPRVLTDIGVAHPLSMAEREQLILHTFEPEDADIFQGDSAGVRYGYGVRGRIYWWWWQRNVVMQWLMDFLQTIGVGGLMIYYYEENNNAALSAATAAANNQQSSQAIMMPRRRNLQGGVDEVNKVDRIEASQAGADLVWKIIVDYFNQVIRDYILMERLTTRTGSTGLGSNVAAAHERTAADRQRYDAESLDETLTRDLLWTVQRYTWPHMPPERCPLRFKSDVDQPNPLEYMQSAQMFMALGGTVKEDKARSIIGFEKPRQGEAILGGQQMGEPAPSEEEQTGEALRGDQEEVEKDAMNPEGGFHTPWDRAEAARKGWETRRGAVGKTRSRPFSRQGSPIRLARKRRRFFVYECPKCGGDALNGDARSGNIFRGTARCNECLFMFPHMNQTLRSKDGPFVPERGGPPAGTQSNGVAVPIPVVQNGKHNVPNDMEGDLSLGTVKMAKKKKATPQASEMSVDLERAGVSKRIALELAADMPAKNRYTRWDLGYREAESEEVRCGKCQHMLEVRLTNQLGTCGLFAKLKEDDAAKWNILPDVGLHMVCSAFEPEKEKKKYASTQVELSGPLAEKVKQLGASIPESDLAEDGAESHPHITVLYGFHDDDPAEAARIITEFGQVKAVFGKLSLFENDEADILKVEVDSDDLHRLHEQLASLPHTDTHPDYTPHMTLAYLKKGIGKRYLKNNPLEGQRVSFDCVVFSTKDRRKISIAVSDKEPEEPRGLAMSPVVRDNGKLTLVDGGPLPDFVKAAAIPKAWADIMVADDQSSAIWLTAHTEDGTRKVVFNPAFAAAFARRQEVMEMISETPDDVILEMANDGAVEPPYTPDDLLAALATRMALRQEGQPHEIAAAISRQLGKPVDEVVSRLVDPAAWLR